MVARVGSSMSRFSPEHLFVAGTIALLLAATAANSQAPTPSAAAPQCEAAASQRVRVWPVLVDAQVPCVGWDKATALSVGLSHRCWLTAPGQGVTCYARADWPEAAGHPSPDAIAVSAGGRHTCVLLVEGNVDCYGDNDYGQAEDYSGGDATSVATGKYHTCILVTSGNVHCQGGWRHTRMPDYRGGDAVAIDASDETTCVLRSNGNMYCVTPFAFGDGVYEEHYDLAGQGVAISVGEPSCALLSSGNVRCFGWNELGQAEPYDGGDAVAVAAGYGYSCILLANGNTHCRGSFDEGSGVFDYEGGDAIAIGSNDHSICLLVRSGDILCSHEDVYGTPNRVPGPLRTEYKALGPALGMA